MTMEVSPDILEDCLPSHSLKSLPHASKYTNLVYPSPMAGVFLVISVQVPQAFLFSQEAKVNANKTKIRAFILTVFESKVQKAVQIVKSRSMRSFMCK